MKLIFDTHNNDKQKQAAHYWINKITTEIMYGGGKGGGKSYLLASLIFGDAFLYPGTHYFIARKKLNDLRRFTIPTIHEVFGHWGLDQRYYKYNGQDSFFELFNKSKIFLLDAKYLPSDPLYQRFGSMQMTRGAIEEAGEFEQEAKNNLQASIGRWKNDTYQLTAKLLETCNPSKNYLYQDYKNFKDGNLEPYKAFIQALPTDNKMLPDGYIENLERSLSTNEKERLLFGNWEYDDDPMALCDYDAILDIFDNKHLKTGNVKYISADIARYGSDKAVIGVWDGWILIDIKVFDYSSTVQIEDQIRLFMQKYSIPKRNIVCDEDGTGGGIIDHLNCKGFINNSKPAVEKGVKVNYYNLQSQCGFKLADRINNSEISIRCNLNPGYKDNIIQELEVLKRADIDSKLKLINKDDVKKLIGRSPDFRDMMLMRAYFDVKKSGNIIITGSSNSR